MHDVTAGDSPRRDDETAADTSTGVARHAASRHEFRGSLRPGELAEAAVLGDLALVFVVIGWFVPLGSVFLGLAIVPFAALAARQRARAVMVAVVAVGSVAFLVGGIGIDLQVALVGSLGMAVGLAYRRRWRQVSAVGTATLVTALPVALVTLAIEAVSPGLRHLAFAQIEVAWRVVAKVLHSVAKVLHSLHLDGLATALDRMVVWGTRQLAWFIAHWWITVPVFEFLLVVLAAALCTRYLWPLLGRLERDSPAPVVPVERVDPDVARATGPQEPPRPVPLELAGVSYQYPGTFSWALAQVSMHLNPGSFIALVGPNGSGKSTLVRLVSGRLKPSLGVIERTGDPGLGAHGGTAMVAQRPESQVLGVRARDDIVWGLPANRLPDVGALLARVGLACFEDRETSGLSGGELQRLAIAAALAREPQLLISDESTAMIDAPGRSEVMALLESLAASGIAVVHVTHRESEAARADEVILMRGGRRVAPGAPSAFPSAGVGAASPKTAVRSVPPGMHAPMSGSSTRVGTGPGPTAAQCEDRRPRASLLQLKGVGYVYAQGTPWAWRALEGVDLDVAEGEGVVVSGSNGSGKSTLAWVIAGLSAPTEGDVLLAGDPVVPGAAAVGIAFQHSRLQLIRATVLADVAYGADDDRATAAMRSVGLDPRTMGERRVDELSGGEQRRVALAGLLVRGPRLLVLDEPYAGLDDEARQSLAVVLSDLRSEQSIATVVVSHDLDNAELLGRRLVRLEAGRIVSDEPLGAAQ